MNARESGRKDSVADPLDLHAAQLRELGLAVIVDRERIRACGGSDTRGVRMDIERKPGQSVMVGRLEDLAVRVRRIGLVAELVHGSSYPVLVVRVFSPVVARVMAGAVHFWWYGNSDDVYPIAPVDDPASVTRHIHDRAVGARS